MKKREVYIVSALRTPIGAFGGSLSSLSAPKLGGLVIKSALDSISLPSTAIDEVYMGNVLQANVGQAPARQAAKNAGLSDNVSCTTINKVCASGMKSIALATQSILLGDANIAVAGGMESMSQTPYYLTSQRWGSKFGNTDAIDGIIKDGLTDAYGNVTMGSCAESCAVNYSFTREEQDEYAINSYKRTASAWKEGRFNEEVIPIEVITKKGTAIVSEDEEYKNVNFDKIAGLKPVFKKDGTITAANSSTINDGAAALILMDKETTLKLGLKPLARIVSYADAEQAPENFTTSPSVALPKALGKANLKVTDIDYFEINEAFSVVALANMKILELNPDKVNVNGGAVSMGHPLGCSGARIVVSLINILKQNNAKYGAAAICNGGGGASALIIENIT
ncbi:MAG: acetyl-CoA C-acyltransferase [Chitinophagaceae bacterium]|jgi:acetyl-CoA C-acetyltransferase|nr:acetyl-CoA C-acyltransferase [Chitinophagaceae bacterium]